MSAYYPATFTENDLISAATVVLKDGQYTQIGEYTVKADELIGIGRGAGANQQEAIGRLFATFFDTTGTPVAITKGKFRVMITSSQEIPITDKPIVVDVDLAAITTGKTVPSDRYALPFDNRLCKEDRKIKFFIKNSSGGDMTLSKANSTVLMDMTRALQ